MKLRQLVQINPPTPPLRYQIPTYLGMKIDQMPWGGGVGWMLKVRFDRYILQHICYHFSSTFLLDNNFSELVAQLRAENIELREKLKETEEKLEVQFCRNC